MLENTFEEKKAGLEKFKLTHKDMGVSNNYLVGHVVWKDTDGPFEDWNLEMFFSNFSRIWTDVDNENKKVSFLIAGNGEDNDIIFNNTTDTTRLKPGV